MKPPDAVPAQYCSLKRWLDALLDRRCPLRLLACHYFHRRGAFGSSGGHLHEHLLTFVEHGTLIALIDGREMRLQAGEVLFAPPNVFRAFSGVAEGGSVRQYNLRFRLGRAQAQWIFLKRCLRIEQAWELQPALQLLHDLFEHGHAHSEERLRGLLSVLMTSVLARARLQRRRAAQAPRAFSPAQRQRLARFIVERLHEPLGATDLAAHLELSSDYFTRVFRATYGMAPRFYLKRERMRLAAIRLRETSLPLKQIAREVGIAHEALFCRQFRDVIGCRPTTYRRRGFSMPSQGRVRRNAAFIR